MLNAISYIDEEIRPAGTGNSLPTYYVKELSTPIFGTGRNLIMDNWFTSIPLANNKLNDFNLMIVATLRKKIKDRLLYNFFPTDKNQ